MPQPTTWALELGTLDRDHPSFSGGNEAMMLCKDGTGGTWSLSGSRGGKWGVACLLHMQGEHGFSFLFALSERHYRAFPVCATLVLSLGHLGNRKRILC